MFDRYLACALRVGGLAAAIVSPLACAQGLLEIERYSWTDAVDRSTREFGRAYKSPARTPQLYLWMQVRGTPELLQQLRETAEGRLPIRHKWYRYDSDQVRADHDVTVDLDIGRKDDLRKLSYEVDALGFFRWRIWSGKEHLARGWWRVDVVYESNEPVMCGGGRKPCSYSIEVR